MATIERPNGCRLQAPKAAQANSRAAKDQAPSKASLSPKQDHWPGTKLTAGQHPPMPGTLPTYRGARFFKCDLQMHTPMDRRNWRGDQLGAHDDEALTAAAEQYVDRCYEAGLEVVALTDHNFASEHFIPYLREAAKRRVLNGADELVILPGFEILANVGRGCHVIALFDTDADLDLVKSVMVQCGIGHPPFRNGIPVRSERNLAELLTIVQGRTDAGATGLIICPHSVSEAGIFDTDRIAEWLQQAEYTNPDLLCLEVPKPVDQMSEGWQKLLGNGPDCLPDWRRTRPIATIMSSDAKALTEAQNPDNYVGRRHTWIKMSEPSIEALRQAFLDPGSRVRLQERNPDDEYQHPRILGMSVAGAGFLEDQTIAFSPNLNTIIGGRGTGKSTLVEYARIGLGQEESVQGDDPRENLAKIKRTIASSTRLQFELEKEAQRWTVEKQGREDPRLSSHETEVSLPTFFPVRVFSQREIYAIAESTQARRRLIEDVNATALKDFARKEEDRAQSIREVNEQVALLLGLQRRQTELRTEIENLDLKIQRLEERSEDLAGGRAVITEHAVLSGVEGELQELPADVRTAIKELAERFTLPPTPENTPNQSLLEDLARDAQELVGDLGAAIEEAVKRFVERVSELLEKPELVQLARRLQEHQDRLASIRDDLVAAGVNPDSYYEYQNQRTELTREYEDLQGRIGVLTRLKQVRDGAEDGDARTFNALHEIWRDASSVREQCADHLMREVPRTESGEPFVRVAVEPYGDRNAFLERLRDYLKDRRRISEDDWDDFMSAVFDKAQEQGVPPPDKLVEWHATLRAGNQPTSSPWAPTDRQASVVLDCFSESDLAEIRLFRVPDMVRVTLFRQDGTEVGELEEGSLSVGQRCTAVLALLLAGEDTPVVIDQPEEDLDNQFIYEELVPLLRKMKEQRQIIVVSHNANVPVNGDAELIAALEVEAGRGNQRTRNGQLAVGALDQLAVRVAVEEIMEGSEEAFRKRREKYGF